MMLNTQEAKIRLEAAQVRLADAKRDLEARVNQVYRDRMPVIECLEKDVESATGVYEAARSRENPDHTGALNNEAEA